MGKLASVLAAYAAFALLHAARPRRLPRGLAPRFAAGRAWGPTLRLAACGAFVLSAWLWGDGRAGVEGAIMAFVALTACASLFVVLAPLVPRLTWGVALLALPLVAALSLLAGGGRGR
jgi:hypothetical protein